MRGRPKKKCISIEQYTICPSNYQGEHIYQMNRAQLLDNSIRTAQSYSNNCQPYNLLFEMFQENELFFFEYEQGHLLNRIGTSLIDILELLTPREEKVIKLSFGIEDSIVRTAAEVAAEFNVTTNRIQEIKEKALRKLRHPSRKGKLAQIFFSAQELPSVPDGYPQKEIYESFIRELCRRMEERVRAFSQVGDSVEEIYLLALSKVYPKELIIRYFDGIRNKYPQLFRKIDKEALYSGSLGCLNLPNQLRTVLYWLLRDRAYSDTYNELYDLYLIFLTEDFSKILESKGGIGEIRTKEIIDVCYRYFKEHDLIRDTDGLYNGSFLKDTILNLEKLSTENKSSIVSPYIPPDYLEIFLELNYRSVEDLISDCQNGELKKRCESEYSKAVLGDVYNIVSEFTEAFIKKPVNYIRIRLLDYEDLPECIAMSLKAEVRKHRKSKNRIDDL